MLGKVPIADLLGSAPMQPVTITLPFSAMAWPMASRDSGLGAVEEAAGVDDHDIAPSCFFVTS
jgi:hypothetical protein